jgi:hypothetical protein
MDFTATFPQLDAKANALARLYPTAVAEVDGYDPRTQQAIRA